MKRAVCLILALLALFSLLSCSSSLATEEPIKAKTEEKKTESPAEKNKKNETRLPEDFVYPDTFSVGYSRKSIAPEVFPITNYTKHGYQATSNLDLIQLTCTALCDGEDVVLICGVDLKNIPQSLATYSAKLVERATGVPKERLFLNATHIHYGPDPSSFGLEENTKIWQSLFYERLIEAVTEAITDLTPAKAFVGSAHTEGVTFVRRYLLANGTYKFNPSQSDDPIAHESEPDTEMRVIRFERENAEDVVMVNYQTHYGNPTPTQISADFVAPLRDQTEAELGCNFIYLNGASGNLNFMSAIPGERKYPTVYDAAPVMVETIKTAIQNEKQAEVGKLQWEYVDYSATTTGGNSKAVNLSAITCGAIGFAAAPYEMFDTNGMEIRAASPCEMTFICAYTNGSMGYVPSALAFTHGAYEVDSCQFREGCGEEFAAELVRLLHNCKAKDLH